MKLTPPKPKRLVWEKGLEQLMESEDTERLEKAPSRWQAIKNDVRETIKYLKEKLCE